MKAKNSLLTILLVLAATVCHAAHPQTSRLINFQDYSTPDKVWSEVEPHMEQFYNLSPYSYCGGDPINYVDPTGNTIMDVVLGVASAVVDNMFGGNTNIREHTGNYVEDPCDFNSGLTVGDAASAAAGAAMAGTGGAMVSVGTSMVSAGAAAAIPSAGGSLVASGTGITTISAGAALGAEGSIMMNAGSPNGKSKKGHIKDENTISVIVGNGQNAKKVELVIPEGYRRVKGFSHGKKIFTNGKNFITPDADSHNGASWKMAKSIKDLKTKKDRYGSYDENLNKIHK